MHTIALAIERISDWAAKLSAVILCCADGIDSARNPSLESL